MPGPERGDEGERQDEAREGHEDVGDAHQHAVGPAAEIAGRGADDQAEDRRGQRDKRDDGERRARAVDDAAPDVAAELVGAEEMPAGAGRQQAVLQRLGVRVVGGEKGREDRRQDECGDDREPEHRHGVPQKPQPGEIGLHGARLQPGARRVGGEPGPPAGGITHRGAHDP